MAGLLTIQPATAVPSSLNRLFVQDGNIIAQAGISAPLTGDNTIDCAIDMRDGTLNVIGNIDMDPDRRRSDINFVNNGNGTITATGTIVTGTLRMRTISGDLGSTISGATSLTVGTNITVNHSGAGNVTGPATISCPLILTANRQINVVGDGNDATEDFVISGVISDGGGDFRLIKAGDGSLTLSAANTFTDDVRLNAGRLNINHAQALGLGNSGDPLDINGGIIGNTSGGLITLTRGSGSMAFDLDADFTFIGPDDLDFNTGEVRMSADITITVDAGALTFGGTLNEPTQSLTKEGAGSLVFGTSDVNLNNLTIENGTFTPPNGAGTLNLAGDLTNNGVLIVTSGSATFSSASDQSISGASAVSFNNLTNSGGGTLTLNRDVDVEGTLTFSSSSFDLNGNTLTLGTSAVSTGTLVHGETAGDGVFYGGSFARYVASGTIAGGSVAGFFPMGTSEGKFRPTYISAPVVGITTGGLITVLHNEATVKDPTDAVSIADGGSTIEVRHNSNWGISTGGGLAGGTYNLVVGGEGFGVVSSVNDLRVMLAASTVGSAGTNFGTAANSRIQRTGLSAANLSNSFYLGSVNSGPSPLPVELGGLMAEAVNSSVEITWNTHSEIQNEGFFIERSTDGVMFSAIGFIDGQGNSQREHSYKFTDDEIEPGQKYYYRLIQRDWDGTQQISPIVFTFVKEVGTTVDIFPNPSDGYFTIRGSSAIDLVQAFDSSGMLIEESAPNAIQVVLQLTAFPPGIYTLRLHTADGVSMHRVVIQ